VRPGFKKGSIASSSSAGIGSREGDEELEGEDEEVGSGAAAAAAPKATARGFSSASAGTTVSSPAYVARAEAILEEGRDSASSSSSPSTKLNLRDKRFAEDERPLVPGCPCFACAGTGAPRLGAPPREGGGSAAATTAAAAAGGGVRSTHAPVSHPGHMRSYVHHLLVAHEMLGPVLLSLHNTYVYGAFLAEARAAIGRGELDKYASWWRRANGFA
jgi:hypothetical protein